MHHPDRFFDRTHECAIVDTKNPYIVSGHLLCAAAELPLDENRDREFFGDSLDTVLGELVSHDLIRRTARGWVYAGRGRAADAVQLDGMPGESFRIVCNGRLLETMNRGQAFREAHKGAIMLHQAETYVVSEMDLDLHTIRVAPTEVDYYTQPLKEVDLTIINAEKTRTILGADCFFGEVEVREQYTAYKIKRGDTIIGIEPLSLPPLVFRTKAFWIVPAPHTDQNMERDSLDPAGSLHGAEHALIAMMPLHVMCDRWDVGGLSSAAFGDTGKPVIFVYDGYEGGIGLAEKAFETLPDLIKTSWELVRDCGCDVGCPSCIYSPKCGNDNQPLDKKGTVMVLRDLCTGADLPEELVAAGAGYWAGGVCSVTES